MPIYLVSGVLILIGGTALYTVSTSSPDAHIYGFSILTAFGNGLTVQLGYAIATMKVAPKDIPNAISLQNVSQIGSTLIALVISGQVFQSGAFSNLSEALGGLGFTDSQIRDAVADARSEVFEALNEE